MDNGADAVIADGGRDNGLIVDARLNERHVCRHSPAETCHQIVDDDNAIARIAKCQYRMAADISCPAGDEDCGSVGHLCGTILRVGKSLFAAAIAIM